MFSSEEKAFFAPFAAFLGFLALNQFIAGLFDGLRGPWYLTTPHFWIYPVQTVVCGGLVARNWRHYRFSAPVRPLLAVAMGVLIIAIWLAPQVWFGAAPRLKGFDPTKVGEGSVAYWFTVIFRFLRLVVVVPFVEEIFWRGYLLRMIIGQPFTSIPIGAFSWASFGIVVAGFTLIHQPADYAAAIAGGVLFNLLVYRSRSLSSCVLAHAVANLLLGIFVMRTGQWGFW